ncbi:MAG: hypothetical protein AW09_003194 [Candidatus Accumulibacter phosphatis]|uniref:Uncharacterized protein n=1 Tax=Candidatus Accumulibacter phosphatis TaxID=327160 RepID=A0A080LVD3_9PROT|nr:MAG: hypothetical protein AW09_003194 [Candidatus Accumulibacter phosphatis]
MVAAHALGSGFERLALCWWQAGECLLQFVLREFEFGHRMDPQGIETPGVLDHCGVAVCFHLGEDAGDRLFDAGILRRLEGQQRIEAGLEVGVRAG